MYKKKKDGNERKGETGRKEARDREGERVCVLVDYIGTCSLEMFFLVSQCITYFYF